MFLLLGGLFSTAALIAVYNRLRETDAAFALWALLLGLVGAVGSTIHGGYDLANAIHPPTSAPPDLPSQIDPRGLLTFGIAGIALFVVAWLAAPPARPAVSPIPFSFAGKKPYWRVPSLGASAHDGAASLR